MEVSDLIAMAALGVSALSAIYSYRTVSQAKRANELALHAQKVAIYEEVVSFSDCFRGLFSVPTSARLEQFKKNAVQRSELYLSETAYTLLNEIYKHCSESEIWLSIANSEGQSSGDKPTDLEVRREYKSVLDLLYPVIDLVKQEAKIDHT